MKQVTGIGGAPGQVLLEAIVMEDRQFVVRRREVQDHDAEVERFSRARSAYIEKLGRLYDESMARLGEDSAKIFKAYATIASDDIFFKKPIKAAQADGCNIDYAIEAEKQCVCEKFSRMNDAYMQERANDIRNVCDAIIRWMNGLPEDGLAVPDRPFVLVAAELTPEDTVRFDKRYLGGFVVERGGASSHAVILAKSLGIPAVVGAQGVSRAVKSGQRIYINGEDGSCIVEPDDDFVRQYEARKQAQDAQNRLYARAAAGDAVTKDGRRVSVCVNSGDEDSIARFDPGICDGIGLLRTEFLFMKQRDYPDEDAQFAVYRSVAERAQGREVIIRTLDIGGDKQLAYMDLPREENPFLGYRAIRICLDRPEMFLTQLRAILRASAFGKVKVMFPMIVELEELLDAKRLLEEAKASLHREGTAFNEAIETGVMIETAAAVLAADVLARHVHFFSIGTNDLIQYITATDRMNDRVQHLYSPYSLSVLRAIQDVIRAGHEAGIRVGMCGELASDPSFAPLLLGMGLDEFSVAPFQVGRLKHLISHTDTAAAAQLADDVMKEERLDRRRALLRAER